MLLVFLLSINHLVIILTSGSEKHMRSKYFEFHANVCEFNICISDWSLLYFIFIGRNTVWNSSMNGIFTTVFNCEYSIEETAKMNISMPIKHRKIRNKNISKNEKKHTANENDAEKNRKSERKRQRNCANECQTASYTWNNFLWTIKSLEKCEANDVVWVFHDLSIHCISVRSLNSMASFYATYRRTLSLNSFSFLYLYFPFLIILMNFWYRCMFFLVFAI